MDIIETSDGGYAVSGIINVHGGVADAVIIKLNTNADITWTKRFDRGDGEDGVGVIENGTNLISTCDLQNSGFDYDFAVLRLRKSDGQIIASKKFHPSSRGVFNPYIFKDVSNNGFRISGHMMIWILTRKCSKLF